MADVGDMAEEITVKQHARLYSGNFDPYAGHYVRMMARLSATRVAVCDQHTNADQTMDYNVQLVEVNGGWTPQVVTTLGGTTEPPNYELQGFWWDSGAADIHRVSDNRALILGITLGAALPPPATGFEQINQLKLVEFDQAGNATIIGEATVATETSDSNAWYRSTLHALNDGRFLLVAWPELAGLTAWFYRIRVEGTSIVVEQTSAGPTMDSFKQGAFCTPLIFDDLVVFPTGRQDPTSTFDALPSLWPLDIETLTLGPLVEPTDLPTGPAPAGRLTRATSMVGVVVDSTTAFLALGIRDATWDVADYLYTVTVTGGSVTLQPLPSGQWPSNVEDPSGGTWIDPTRPESATQFKVLFGTGLSTLAFVDADTVAWVVKVGDASWDDNEIAVFYWRWREGTLVDWHLLKGDLFIDVEPVDIYLFEDSLHRLLVLDRLGSDQGVLVLMSEYYEVAGASPAGYDWYNNIYLSLLALPIGDITGDLVGARRRFSATPKF